MSAVPLPPSPLVYEINTRIWLHELSKRYNQPLLLDNVPDEELDRIAELGFHAIWLMGVWTTGAVPQEIARTHSGLQQDFKAALPDISAEDCVGSPYAISAYSVSPRLGGPAGLAKLRERLSRKGIGVILDFVCNHTACDYWQMERQPEVFIQGSDADLAEEPGIFFRSANGRIFAHARDPYFPPWTDTAQINYAQPAAREAMLSTIEEIATQCDGVRCDMAMLILPSVFFRVWGKYCGPNPIQSSFWREAIPAVLAKHPNFMFIAEAYWNTESQLQAEGFQYTYDKTLYDRLLRQDVNGVRQHLAAPVSFQSHCLRFIENHDEPRAVTAFGGPRSIAAAAAMLFSPGMKLLHDGQLEGRRVKVPVQLDRRPHENEDAAIETAYDHFLTILRDPIFQSGSFSLAEVSSSGPGDRTCESLLALRWTHPSSLGTRNPHRCGYLIVINLSGTRAYARMPFSPSEINGAHQYCFEDRFACKRYDREGNELLYPGLYIALEAYQPHVFEITEKV